jgi:uncharacterized protein YjbI with pentapeptide repeats
LKAPGRSDPAKLSFFDLSGLRFNGHNLSQADFAGSSLEFANLRRSQLTAAIFYAGDLRMANFKGSDLTGADLRGACLRGAVLTDAIFENADLSGGSLMRQGGGSLRSKSVDLSGIIGAGTNFTGAEDLPDLVADPHHGIERAHRFLKYHAHAPAPQVTPGRRV